MTARSYEGLFLIDNNRANQSWDDTVAGVTKLLEKYGGSVQKSLKWEERKLSYEIKGHRRGTYLLSYFDIQPESVSELRRDLQLSDLVVRSVIVRFSGKMLSGPEDLFADGASSTEAVAATGSIAPIAAGGSGPGPLVDYAIDADADELGDK